MSLSEMERNANILHALDGRMHCENCKSHAISEIKELLGIRDSEVKGK